MIKLPHLLKAVSISFALLTAVPVHGQDLAELADGFLNTLSADLRSKAQFTFNDAERFNWNFVPIARKGPTFRDFDDKQKSAAISLLRASLSEQGYKKISSIMELEEILKVIESRGAADNYRDPLNYHFSIFGKPSSRAEWGWRFEGHHISLNFSSTKGVLISSTPFFLGSNPAIVKSGEKKGLQILKKEEELGFLLLNSLDQTQLKKAHFSEKAPSEIITSNNRKASLLNPTGVEFRELKAYQKKYSLICLMFISRIILPNFRKNYSRI